MLVYSCTAFAADVETVLDVSVDYLKNITTVSADVGGIYADRRVNIIILNPGFAISDLSAGTDGAINWAEQTYVGDDGRFSVDLALSPLESGNNPTYTAVVAVDTMSSVLISPFELYNNNYVDEVMAQIKSAISSGDRSKLISLTEQYAGLVGILQTPEYKTYTAYSSEVKLRAAGGLIKENPQTVEEFKNKFVSVIRTVELDKITDADDYEAALMPLIGGAASSVKNEFSKMTASDKAELIKEFMETEFDCPKGLADKLNDVFVLGGINSSKLWTEIAKVYEKYSDVLNVKTAVYAGLNDKRTPMSGLIGRDFKTIQAAADAYDNAVEAQKLAESNSSNSDSGSKGGGGSGGGGRTSAVTGPVSVDNKPNTDIVNNLRFTDLAGYEWAADDINTLVAMGVVNGYSDGTFAPGNGITRAEFTKLFVSAFGTDGKTAEINFADVKPTDWFYDSVKAAYAVGYIQGVSDELFAPNEFVTREDIAVMLCRYLGVSYNEETGFADAAEISDYAKEAVSTLSHLGIIKGLDGNVFCPKKSALRAEVSSIIVRALKIREVQ